MILLNVKRVLVSCAALLIMASPLVLVPQAAYAQTAEQKKAVCEGAGNTWNGTTCITAGGRSVPGLFRQIANILVFIVGAVAVIMLIVGGLRYTLSTGDEKKITSAKNTILYSVVGIVVAFASYAIVNFVLDNLG